MNLVPDQTRNQNRQSARRRHNSGFLFCEILSTRKSLICKSKQLLKVQSSQKMRDAENVMEVYTREFGRRVEFPGLTVSRNSIQKGLVFSTA